MVVSLSLADVLEVLVECGIGGAQEEALTTMVPDWSSASAETNRPPQPNDSSPLETPAVQPGRDPTS